MFWRYKKPIVFKQNKYRNSIHFARQMKKKKMVFSCLRTCILYYYSKAHTRASQSANQRVLFHAAFKLLNQIRLKLNWWKKKSNNNKTKRGRRRKRRKKNMQTNTTQRKLKLSCSLTPSFADCRFFFYWIWFLVAILHTIYALKASKHACIHVYKVQLRI